MARIRIDEFIRGRDIAPKTIEHYRFKLQLLADYVGRRQLSLNLLAEYPGWLRSRGYADASIQSIVAAARAYIRWAIERGYAPHECARWRPKLRVNESIPKAADDTALDRLLAAANKRDRALLLALADTGARVGTILALDVGDIDWPRRRATVRQKGGRLVMVYLSERLVEALREYLGERAAGPLFVGRAGRLSVAGARHALKRLAARAGVHGRVNPHSWRHAFARRCVRAGLDLSRTARLLGHRSYEVTARYYAVWDGDELADAFRRVVGM